MKCQVNGCGWKHHAVLHVKKKSNNDSTLPNHPAVTSEETGANTISGAGETETSAVSGAGDGGRCDGKKNVYLVSFQT